MDFLKELDEVFLDLGEALPEMASTGMLFLGTPVTADLYSQGNLALAIPMTLMQLYFAGVVYKGLLRGDLFYRWSKRKDYPDPLKILYNKVKSVYKSLHPSLNQPRIR